MSELDILITFFPLIFISFDSLGDLKKILGWSAVILAIICNVYQMRLYLDNPLRWLPVAAFLSALILEQIQKRSFRGLTMLGALFVVQALLTEQLPGIVILLIFADVFFCAKYFTTSDTESKNRAMQSLFRAMISFLPATIGILLQLQGEWLGVAVGATVLLRLFSWPFSNWVTNIAKDKNIFLLCVGSVSSFALWRTQSVGQEALWGLIWLIVACVFSFGAEVTEVLTALTLGAFCLSPVWAVLIVSFWPIMLRYQTMRFLLVLFTGIFGIFTVPIGTRLFVPEVEFGIAAFSALLISRVIVRTYQEKVSWVYDLSAFVLSAGVVVGSIFLYPEIIAAQDLPPVGITFGASLLFFYLGGLFLIQKKPGFYKELGRINIHIPLITRLKIREELSSQVVTIGPPSVLLEKIFSHLESESHLIILIGLLGAFLLWGIK